jgi:hypothetical protein
MSGMSFSGMVTVSRVVLPLSDGTQATPPPSRRK